MCFYMVLDSVATSYIGWPPPAFCLHLRRALFVPFDDARVVQGERRAELARAMLSRSLHSRCISNASQRYYISIAVYEYISKIILSILCLARSFGHLVIWSFVKIEN